MKIPNSLIVLARGGDLSAQCRVAEHFMSAESKDGYRRALPWLRRAARSGERWAEYHLGLIYDHGLAGRRDLRRAMLWYERSAAKGYASAQLNLGILIANRRGTLRDLRRAVELYRLAARQGRGQAAYNLGLYYSEGRGVPTSTARARYWYHQAAELGDRDARRILKNLGRVSNPRVQRSHSRVTALAEKRKGRATRRAADAHRWAAGRARVLDVR